MRKIFLFVGFVFLVVALLGGSGFIFVQYEGVLFDSFVAVACIVVSALLLLGVVIGNYRARRFSLTDLIPLIALVAFIVLVNLFLSLPARKAPPGAPAGNSNVQNGGKKND